MVKSFQSSLNGCIQDDFISLKKDLLNKNYDPIVVEQVFALLEKYIGKNTVISKLVEEAARASIIMAYILLSLDCDIDTLKAALLYNFIDVEDLTLIKIEELFGKTCVNLIIGTKKMQILAYKDNTNVNNKYLENLRQMLLAMVDDVRVVLIKLAERLCVMRLLHNDTQKDIMQHKQIASDIMLFYAPLANRLGLGALKWELEDLAFRELNPVAYKEIATGLNSTRIGRDKDLSEIIYILNKELKTLKLEHYSVSGRSKHIYSIYRKMQNKNLSFQNIYDTTAVRVLVKHTFECYEVLGLVHNLWTSMPQEFDDYIAKPKANGYQSLHTAVLNDNSKIFEVQIRTIDMHAQAEKGVAAHWKYKEGNSSSTVSDRKIAWLRELMAWQKEVNDNEQKNLPDFLEDTIYAFTPKGDVLALPLGSTVLDFAYAIHTEVGHRCKGAKINGSIVPLTKTISMSDKIEILTGKESKPSRDWLNPQLKYLYTARARNKIKHWFKLQDEQTYPQQISTENLAVVSSKVLRQKNKTLNILPKYVFLIEGIGNLVTHLAQCCKPEPGEPIIAYMTLRRGIAVHAQSCGNMKYIASTNNNRFLHAEWK